MTQIITATRVNEILDRSVFSDLAQDETKMRKCAAAFGIDQSEEAEFHHQREMAKTPWRLAPSQDLERSDDSTVDAAAKAHGEPIAMLAMDWNSHTVLLEAKFEVPICARKPLRHKPASRSSTSTLSEGSLESEHLREVVSQEDADIQRKSKPDPARQYGMDLDGRLTLQTHRRFSSTEPASVEQLRAKVHSDGNSLAIGAVAPAGPLALQRPHVSKHFYELPHAAVKKEELQLQERS